MHLPPFSDFVHVSTLTLATGGLQAQPHTAPVYYVALQLERDQDLASWRLYFFSDQTSEHAQQFTENPNVAAAIYPECSSWQDIRGLQIHGTVQQIDPGAEWQNAWEAYQQKFPFVRQLKAIVSRSTLFALTPHWVRLVDNRRGFGFKQEWKI